jgi:hypothetical protein
LDVSMNLVEKAVDARKALTLPTQPVSRLHC